ncbi:unnamed protein product [Choristocarpus tenellus]
MMGRGPTPCRFGTQCHRMDCWYSHPEGRIIDNGSSYGGGMPMRGGGRGGPMRSGMMPSGGGPPGGAGSPIMGGGGQACRFGFGCHRRDCHFSHPGGRKIDSDGRGGSGASGGGGGGARQGLIRFPSNSSIGSMTRGMSEVISEVSFGSYRGGTTDDDQDLKDTWFPRCRDCSCCKGYMYGCKADICESIGQCTCSIEEKDLDGGSMISSSDSSSLNALALGLLDAPPRMGGLNGGLGPHGAGNGAPGNMGALRSPRLNATSVGGGLGPRGNAMGGGGGVKLCRYGVGCTRPDCLFGHPQGRSIDKEGVSFGDFRYSKAGEGKGKKIVDQDLMDTWYPDSRNCTCCKGYKYGCKNPACAEAGLCSSCSSSAVATGEAAAATTSNAASVSPPPPPTATPTTSTAATPPVPTVAESPPITALLSTEANVPSVTPEPEEEGTPVVKAEVSEVEVVTIVDTVTANEAAGSKDALNTATGNVVEAVMAPVNGSDAVEA